MKRIVAILLSAMLLCAVIAPMALAEDKTTLTILWWGSQTRHDLTVKLIEKFEELNPDIDIVMDYSDWGGYWTKLSAQVAGSQTPDIFQMDYAYLSQYAENGVLADLGPFVESGALNTEYVSQDALLSGSIGGKLYAVSTGSNAPVMLYRKDLVEEAGVTLPMNPTMSEYIAVAKAVYEKTGVKDLYISDASIHTLRFRLRNQGLNLYNDNATALGFDDPKYVSDMWRMALDAQHEGWGLCPGEGTATGAFDSMVNDAWSRMQNSNELQAYRDATGKDLSMVMVPNTDDAIAGAAFLKPAMFWCIAEQCEKKDAAIRFIDFFTNSPDCFDIVGIERAMPISSAMRTHVAASLDAVGQEVAAFIDYASQPGMVSPLMNADPTAHSEIEELLSQYTEQVRYEMVDDLDALAQQFMDEANAILSAPKAE